MWISGIRLVNHASAKRFSLSFLLAQVVGLYILLYYTFAITLLSTTLALLLFYWPHNASEPITLRLWGTVVNRFANTQCNSLGVDISCYSILLLLDLFSVCHSKEPAILQCAFSFSVAMQELIAFTLSTYPSAFIFHTKMVFEPTGVIEMFSYTAKSPALNELFPCLCPDGLIHSAVGCLLCRIRISIIRQYRVSHRSEGNLEGGQCVMIEQWFEW